MKITNRTDYAKSTRKTFTLTIITLMLAAMIIPAALAAEITTAKLYYYYPEDQSVDIVGVDFLANANVTITINILEANILFTDSIMSNADGSFVYTYPLDGTPYTYVVTATDGANTATMTFYDPLQVDTTTTLNAITTPLTTGQTSVSFSGKVTPVTATPSWPQVPNGQDVYLRYRISGGTWAVMTTVQTKNDDGSFDGTFTAPSSAGTYQFFARFKGYNEGGDGHHWKTSDSAERTVIVAAPSDTTPPVIAVTIFGTEGDNGWYTSDVDVQFSATDLESAITSTTPAGNPYTYHVTTDTLGVILGYWATSDGGTSSQSVTIKRDATAPTIGASSSPSTPNANGWFKEDVTVTFTASDAMSGLTEVFPQSVTLGEGAAQSASKIATDMAGNTATAGVSGINIDKTKPTITTNLADLGVYPKGALTSVLTIEASDGLSGIATGTLTSNIPTGVVLEAGVYNLVASVMDKAGNVQTIEIMFVIYDPSAGFVTGGGWIMSPENAYAADPALTGKATFGFVSKYLKGATVPTGNTEFQFHAGSLNFKSTSYDWLVIAGSTAQYKGVGTIAGQTGTFKFMIWADDGGKTVDTFRIRITDMADNVVYDNGVKQPISGSIVVHK